MLHHLFYLKKKTDCIYTKRKKESSFVNIKPFVAITTVIGYLVQKSLIQITFQFYAFYTYVLLTYFCTIISDSARQIYFESLIYALGITLITTGLKNPYFQVFDEDYEYFHPLFSDMKECLREFRMSQMKFCFHCHCN